MRHHRDVIAWVAGAVGRPGERTFYLQFTTTTGVHGYLLEKGQVAALVLEGMKLVAAIGDVDPADEGERGPDPSVMPEFRVGEMHLSYDETDEQVRLRLIATTEDLDPVEFTLSPSLFAGALAAAQVAVEGGRPSCPRCGLAMDPDGHHCPATNGDLRGHRP